MNELQTPIHRILLVALDNLGDLVFASALTPPLAQAFPDASIDVWCKAYTAPVASLIPYVHNVIAADPFWAVPRHRPRPPILPFLSSIRKVRESRYDVAILSEAPWRVAAAVAAARVPVRIGLARHRNQRFLTRVLAAEDHRKPVVQEQSRLLTPLGIQPVAPRYQLDVSRFGAVRDDIGRKLPSSFAALHPFAAQSNRCVPIVEWIQLADALQARGLAVVWIGTRNELTTLRQGHLARRELFVDQLAGGSLIGSAAVLSLAQLFVGHDSGPMHVANALGVPVVGVFAPGQPERTFPQGVGPSRVIYSPTPAGITATDMLRGAESLLVSSAP